MDKTMIIVVDINIPLSVFDRKNWQEIKEIKNWKIPQIDLTQLAFMEHFTQQQLNAHFSKVSFEHFQYIL